MQLEAITVFLRHETVLIYYNSQSRVNLFFGVDLQRTLVQGDVSSVFGDQKPRDCYGVISTVA
jgi:hypothetical protein